MTIKEFELHRPRLHRRLLEIIGEPTGWDVLPVPSGEFIARWVGHRMLLSVRPPAPILPPNYPRNDGTWVPISSSPI